MVDDKPQSDNTSPDLLTRRSQALGYSGYYEYLYSPHWENIKSSFREGHSPKCFICASPKRLNLHHINYTNLGREKDEDLCWLCKTHHTYTHRMCKLHDVPLRRAHLILLRWYNSNDRRIKSLYTNKKVQARTAKLKDKARRKANRAKDNSNKKRKNRKNINTPSLEICKKCRGKKRKRRRTCSWCFGQNVGGTRLRELTESRKQELIRSNEILFEYQQALRGHNMDIIRQKRIAYNKLSKT